MLAITPRSISLLDKCYIDNFNIADLLVASDSFKDDDIPGVPDVMKGYATLRGPWRGLLPNKLAGGVQEFLRQKNAAVKEAKDAIKFGWKLASTNNNILPQGWSIANPGPNVVMDKQESPTSKPQTQFSVFDRSSGIHTQDRGWHFVRDSRQWHSGGNVELTEVPICAKLIVLAAHLAVPYYYELKMYE